jgi:ribosome-associated protein
MQLHVAHRVQRHASGTSKNTSNEKKLFFFTKSYYAAADFKVHLGLLMEKQLTSKELFDLIYKTLDDHKAEDLTIIDLSDKTSLADSMIIASARSSRHLMSLAEHLYTTLKGEVPIKIEGKDGSTWIVVDTFFVIVHLFIKETRELYNLEKLWNTPSLFKESNSL